MTTKNIPPYYTNQSIQRIINVSFIETSTQIKDLLYEKIKNEIEGKCIREGYVRPDSIKIVQYSNGTLNGDIVEYIVLFTCDLFYPAIDMSLKCRVHTNTKEGVTAVTSYNESTSPFIVSIIKNYHPSNECVINLKKGDIFTCTVKAFRSEVNDSYINIIGILS
tara:strand:+ start:3536 stop:4027 length:492 start_codon:yes stop_codon:yes gene_type:complete